jgi:methyl-accepting chemotaxis protein
MQLLKNMRIGIKILLLIITAFLALIVVGLLNISTMDKMSNNATMIYQDALLPVKWLNQLNSNWNEQDANMLETMMTTDNSMLQTLAQRSSNITSQVDKLLTDYGKKNLSPYEAENLKKLNDITGKIREERKKIKNLASQNKKEEAVAQYSQTLYPLNQERHKIIQDLADYNEKEANELNNSNIQSFSHARKISLLILISTLLVCVATGYLITRLVTKPIQVIQNLMKKAESGDLTVRGNYVSKDEIGLLTQSFNAMLDGLRNLIKKIQENSLSLSAMSEELSASAEQSGQAATQITEAVQEVAAGAEKQQNNVKTTENTIEQMTLGVKQISNYSQVVTNKAILASESASEGKKTVEQSVHQMNSIQSSVGNAARSITELVEQAQHIGKIVEVIQSIANQTNLLALNAAIEAARVGEQGKGFTVVATEIRKLAEQSSESAKRIADYIQSIELKMKTAVEDIEAGTKEVADGTIVMSIVSQSFEQIFATVTEVTSQIQEISASAQQIAVGTEEVVNSFNEVVEIASVSSAETQSVSAATEEQLASMEEIAASANSLSNMAEELQGLVSEFKV